MTLHNWQRRADNDLLRAVDRPRGFMALLFSMKETGDCIACLLVVFVIALVGLLAFVMVVSAL